MEEVTILQVKSYDIMSETRDSFGNLKESDSSSSEEDVTRTKMKKRIKRFSASDSDSDKEATHGKESNAKNVDIQNTAQDSDSKDDTPVKSKPIVSRLKRTEDLSDSDERGSDNALKNEEQQLRMTNKRNKLKNKFKSLMSARVKESSKSSGHNADTRNEGDEDMSNESSNASDDESASIDKIKMKIKQKMVIKPSICDPDTSDEEGTHKPAQYRKERKIKLTSPKPQRMTAKQAMENMQKIKSESNRMLREKDVSLPYHRPKALSLKDIMSRRKVAVTADGKALPIKMNGEQLKQYAQMLEERQKEIMELCKSESEEEDNDENADTITENADAVSGNNSNEETNSIKNTNNVNSIDKDKLCAVEKNDEEHSDLPEVNISMNDTQNNEQDSESNIRLVYNESADSGEGITAKEEENSDKNDTHETSPKKSNAETLTNNESNVAINEQVGETETKVAKEVSENSEDLEKIETVLEKSNEDSQLISLHFDTESTGNMNTEQLTEERENNGEISSENANTSDKEYENQSMDVDNEFSDDELNMGDIDKLIENAEIIKDIEDKLNSPLLLRQPLTANPRLTGEPGMVIDLDTAAAPRKSGVALLKERFTYFSKLKTPEELERAKEHTLKPGTQLTKLKQKLEEEISEQRSIEWAKRLEEEKQNQAELKMLRGEVSDDGIDQLDEIIEKDATEVAKSDSEEEEELIEDDIEMKDKVRPKNAMVDDEAEESDCDEETGENGEELPQNGEDIGENDDNSENDEVNEDDENDSESDESASSEEEEMPTVKKGRILKAFEDSDDEDLENDGMKEVKAPSDVIGNIMPSQDEEIHLAQRQKLSSDDLFPTQDNISQAKTDEGSETLTQTFSIMESSKQVEIDLDSSGKLNISDTQAMDVPTTDENLRYTETEAEKLLPLPSQIPLDMTSQSQPIGDDVLALCTGKFYDNQFVSQLPDLNKPSTQYDAFDRCIEDLDKDKSDDENVDLGTQDKDENVETANQVAIQDKFGDKLDENSGVEVHSKDMGFIELKDKIDVNSGAQNGNVQTSPNEMGFIELSMNKENGSSIVDDNLKSILDELADPEFDSPKPKLDSIQDNNKDFVKKRLVIDSDDETIPTENERKKLKKKKAEKRALQISDDEEDLSEEDVMEESDVEEDEERLVEYDSEENEIQVQTHEPKKRRKALQFLEKEAELTSEDEWAGSGDEDERGLDTMEREEGDNEHYDQGELRDQLGHIHMREVLDQDKREVRIIQELLFEDGDLGGGGRQRKFRWNNIEGDLESGSVPDDLDSQELEHESEEQWRKERHERETFLRQMREKEDADDILSVTVNTTSVKATLSNNNSPLSAHTTADKKPRDIPSPKKPFMLMQSQYKGFILSRGGGALSRLAALAAPLCEDNAPCITNKRRNFVFAAVTPDHPQTKVSKRKAVSNPGTPMLVKKMRTEEKNNSKNSLLDHLNV